MVVEWYILETCACERASGQKMLMKCHAEIRVFRKKKPGDWQIIECSTDFEQ